MTKATLNNLRDLVHENARNHGWWDNVEVTDQMLAEKLCLCHSELSEALEELRVGAGCDVTYYNDGSKKPEGFPIELADCIIRILDLCGFLDIDIEDAVLTKNQYNISRPFKHGKRF